MNKIMFVLLSSVLVSCAHKAPEQAAVVHFPYAADLVKEIQKQASRAPASIEAVNDEEGKSVRRVYFTTLYHQYLTLGSHLKKDSSLESCPQFHHDKIETERYSVPKLSSVNQGHVEEEGKDFFPELAFNKKFSLKDYHANLKTEIAVLCEEGLSDNFYKFDNLVTHYSHKKSFHRNPTAMESVLKIPVFANFYLLKMLQNRHEVSFTHPDEKKFINLTQTKWFDQYVSEASTRRNHFMKNKMVQR